MGDGGGWLLCQRCWCQCLLRSGTSHGNGPCADRGMSWWEINLSRELVLGTVHSPEVGQPRGDEVPLPGISKTGHGTAQGARQGGAKSPKPQP